MYSKTPGCFWSPYQNIIGKFGASDNKKCGAYPQEDFLFIKLSRIIFGLNFDPRNEAVRDTLNFLTFSKKMVNEKGRELSFENQ
jgi:hypothetical protein